MPLLDCTLRAGAMPEQSSTLSQDALFDVDETWQRCG